MERGAEYERDHQGWSKTRRWAGSRQQAAGSSDDWAVRYCVGTGGAEDANPSTWSKETTTIRGVVYKDKTNVETKSVDSIFFVTHRPLRNMILCLENGNEI
jgi:hypothetical protein